MTADELLARFPVIPPPLHGHPILDRVAATFGDHLTDAAKPSNCSSHQMTAGHHVYMKLIAPMEVLQYGFIAPESTVKKLEGFLDAYAADPDAFLAEMIPASLHDGPGCCGGEGHAA